MKKHTFARTLAVIALALLPLFSCDLFVEPKTPVVVENDSDSGPRYYTVALAPAGNNTIGITTRALTKEAAMMGHDFFEVVFYANNGATPRPLARANWELGHPAAVEGIYKTSAGVNYNYVNNTSIPQGSGAALMVVGKKEDKTILGFGGISHVDGVPGTRIYPDSKTVTFSIHAVRAGISSVSGQSSFNFLSNNTFEDIDIHERTFQMYKLQTNNASRIGRYTFYIEGVTGSDYETSFYNSQPWTTVKFEKRIPSYLLHSGLYQFSSYIPYDTGTVITTAAPIAEWFIATDYFNGGIGFTFNTTNTRDGTIFALTFACPVNALGRTSTNGVPAVEWFLRPATGLNNFALDDGHGGTGGMILFGTGNVSGYLKGGTP